jgi:hypothetical protein
VSLVCKNCQSTREVPCRPGLGGAIVPRSCDHVPQVYLNPLLRLLAFLGFMIQSSFLKGFCAGW